MKVCIFGAASEHIDDVYKTETEKLGYELAKLKHELVFGAGASGVMGSTARGFTRGGGRITGVIPDFFRDEGIEPIYPKCDEIIYTPTMAERKRTMEDLADAFIIAPGGVGTFEEFFEVITLKQLGRHNKPVIIFDINEYYVDLEKFMQLSYERKFISFEINALYDVTRTVESTVELIQKYAVKEAR
ncbi:MAG: TIGR00730 family Rossman fold protein [Clostridiales bacterium]|nr:TIGR00730 family Rossman fold protein [Clostridiales bacterium]